MPEERSIDIDSELDFTFVEFLARQQAGQAQ
jgi:CMP-N-acetylneuraminic acid synthetase